MSTAGIIIFLVIALAAGVFIAWLLLQDAFVRINPGQVGLVITRGKPADRGLPPGVHFALRFGRVIEIYPAVELAYLTGPDKAQGLLHPDELTFVDAPLLVALGDHVTATLQYTVRFTLTPEGLPKIHLRFGANGIGGIMRDESRRVLIETLEEPSVSLADAFGQARTALEARIAERMAVRLAECGFTLAMFSLREVDLAETGAVIQSTLRAREELALEHKIGPVRVARAEHGAEVASKLAGTLSGPVLEYMRLEVMRNLVERWDGRLLMLPDGLFPKEQAQEQPPEQEQAQ